MLYRLVEEEGTQRVAQVHQELERVKVNLFVCAVHMYTLLCSLMCTRASKVTCLAKNHPSHLQCITLDVHSVEVTSTTSGWNAE